MGHQHICVQLLTVLWYLGHKKNWSSTFSKSALPPHSQHQLTDSRLQCAACRVPMMGRSSVAMSAGTKHYCCWTGGTWAENLLTSLTSLSVRREDWITGKGSSTVGVPIGKQEESWCCHRNWIVGHHFHSWDCQRLGTRCSEESIIWQTLNGTQFLVINYKLGRTKTEQPGLQQWSKHGS